MEQLQSISAIPSVELSFSVADITIAKIIVRELIWRGDWPMPGGNLMLSDSELNRLWAEEAVKYLRLQKARRQGDAKGNEGALLRAESETAAGQLGERLRSLPSEHGPKLQDG